MDTSYSELINLYIENGRLRIWAIEQAVRYTQWNLNVGDAETVLEIAKKFEESVIKVT